MGEESTVEIDAKTGERRVIPKQSPIPSPPPLTDAQLEAMTDEDIRARLRTKLLRMALHCADDKASLPAIKEMLDMLANPPPGAGAGAGGASGIDRIEIVIIDPKADAMPSNLPVQQREGGTGAGGEG